MRVQSTLGISIVQSKIADTETHLRRLRSAVFDIPPEQEASHAELIAKAKRRLFRFRRMLPKSLTK